LVPVYHPTSRTPGRVVPLAREWYIRTQTVYSPRVRGRRDWRWWWWWFTALLASLRRACVLLVVISAPLETPASAGGKRGATSERAALAHSATVAHAVGNAVDGDEECVAQNRLCAGPRTSVRISCNAGYVHVYHTGGRRQGGTAEQPIMPVREGVVVVLTRRLTPPPTTRAPLHLALRSTTAEACPSHLCVSMRVYVRVCVCVWYGCVWVKGSVFGVPSAPR
jgi:hypothetical protein